MSPTQRALKEAKKLGFTCQVVERWNFHAKKRLDLFGVIDIVAIKAGIGIVGIQATSGTNHAARRTKSKAEPKLAEWLASGGRFELWSFSKRGDRGKRKLWTFRREELTAADMDATPESEA